MSLESDNAKQLAKLIVDQGLPHIEDTIPPISISSKALGISNSDFDELCWDIVSKSTKTKSIEYRQSYFNSTRIITNSLIVAGFSFNHLALGTRIKTDGYLSSIKLSRRHIEAITAALIHEGYATLTRKGFKHHSSPQLSKAAQYYPTEKLLTEYCNLLYTPVGDFENYSPYIFKGAEKWEDDWEEKSQIIQTYNSFMNNFSWAKKSPTYRSLGADPFTSGRTYTNYQNIVNRRIPVRTQTLLNGEPLAEVDFKSNHLWLLSAFYDEQLPNDPYIEIAKDAGCSRDEVKRLINPLLGANDKRQLAQIKFNLHDISNERIDAIITSMDRVLPWLNQYHLIFKGVGTKLQYVEGEIALRMFDWAVKERIPMLNIHDAYAVHPSKQSTVNEVMHEVRAKIVDELGWLPHYF